MNYEVLNAFSPYGLSVLQLSKFDSLSSDLFYFNYIALLLQEHLIRDFIKKSGPFSIKINLTVACL